MFSDLVEYDDADNSKVYQDLSKFAENWWEITHEENLNKIDQIFNNDEETSTKFLKYCH